MGKPVVNNITNCMRCGTCCLKGGPILHHEDKKILRAGHIGYEHLITIRKGEPAYNPIKEKLEIVRKEIIKVAGKGENWSCVFYDDGKASCTIYSHRFLECRLLKCWDTSGIMSIIGKNTIIRADIINPDDPIMSVIETHEQECSYQEVEALLSALSQEEDKSRTFKRLSELVRKDLSIRSFALSELELKAEFELFIFGRPLVRVLNERGLMVNGKI
jgi:Fe-S-cluster containining protein